jgi:hypothetical protein
MPNTATDSNGVTWTRQVSGIYDPLSKNDGVEMAVYDAYLPLGLTTAQAVTITTTLSSAGPVAKTWAFHEIVTDVGGKFPQFRVFASGAGSATGTPTITTASITSGEIVVAWGGAESGTDTWAGDADTTNGNWSTHQHTSVGVGAAGMSITSQRKVVTATATQTYNPTLTSADVILAWINYQEVNLPTSRGMAFGGRGTAFNGGRPLHGIIR